MINDIGEYYFDPTNDLHRKIFKGFALNKNEMSKHVALTYRERYTKNAPSMYRVKLDDELTK